MFSNALARRLPTGVTSQAMHPGGVDSEIWRDLPRPVSRTARRHEAQDALYVTSGELAAIPVLPVVRQGGSQRRIIPLHSGQVVAAFRPCAVALADTIKTTSPCTAGKGRHN